MRHVLFLRVCAVIILSLIHACAKNGSRERSRQPRPPSEHYLILAQHGASGAMEAGAGGEQGAVVGGGGAALGGEQQAG